MATSAGIEWFSMTMLTFRVIIKVDLICDSASGHPGGYHPHGPPLSGYGPPPGMPGEGYMPDNLYRGGRGGYHSRGGRGRSRDKGPPRKYEEFKEPTPGNPVA